LVSLYSTIKMMHGPINIRSKLFGNFEPYRMIFVDVKGKKGANLMKMFLRRK